MSLDNGLMLKVFNEKIMDSRAFGRATVFFESPYGTLDDCEVCYWRKCNNVRKLLYEVSEVEDDSFTNGEFPLTYYGVEQFYNLLSNYKYTHQWDREYESGETIWKFADYWHALDRQLHAIDYLLRAVQGYKDGIDYQFYFYDSY